MDTLLEKDFYTIQEALQRINLIVANFDENDLRYYGENEKLKFSLYVGSRPVYAARYNYTTKQMFFIGHCKLHGIFPLQKGDLCGIFTNGSHLIEVLYGHPHGSHLELTNWSTSIPKDAQQAKLGIETIWTPEQYSSELKLTITFFYLRPKIALQMKVIKPGAIVPFNILPENIIRDAIKFDHGQPVQWPESQVFYKNDLRITHENLQAFIDRLIQSKSSTSINASLITPLPSKTGSEQKPVLKENPPKKRRSKKCPRLVSLIRSHLDAGNNYDTFAKDMIEAYLYKNKPNPEDTYTFDDSLSKIYLTEKEPGKYTFHYSVTNEKGKLITRKRSLITLRRYFHEINHEIDSK